MNVEVEFIQVNEAIEQLQDGLTDKSLLGRVLKNQGFLSLDLYFKNLDNDLIMADKFTKSEIYTAIGEVYPIKGLINSNSIFEIFKPSIPDLTSIFLQNKTLKDLSYYWIADEFYKIFDNNKPQKETVVYYTDKTASDKQKKLQSEIAELKECLAEQKHQVQNKSKELTTLQVELDEANARIKDIESQSNNGKYPSVFDKNNEFFAPDLAHAINLWLDTYGNGKKKDDSHTNLANQWIKSNTNYNENSDGYKQVENRIREITTPLKDFGAKRLREK